MLKLPTYFLLILRLKILNIEIINSTIKQKINELMKIIYSIIKQKIFELMKIIHLIFTIIFKIYLLLQNRMNLCKLVSFQKITQISDNWNIKHDFLATDFFVPRPDASQHYLRESATRRKMGGERASQR